MLRCCETLLPLGLHAGQELLMLCKVQRIFFVLPCLIILDTLRIEEALGNKLSDVIKSAVLVDAHYMQVSVKVRSAVPLRQTNTHRKNKKVAQSS